MCGMEVCKALRADPRLASTPIVLLTALADVGVARMGVHVGATRVLRKPLTVDLLLQVMAELCPPGRSSHLVPLAAPPRARRLPRR